MDAETVICFRMTSLFKNDEIMNTDTLNIVHKAMKMDLTKVVDWNKHPDLQHYPDPIPFKHRWDGMNEDYWKWISA